MVVTRVLLGSSLLVALAACGGGDGDDTSGDVAPSAVTVPTGASEVTETIETTDAPGTTDPAPATTAATAATAAPTTTAVPTTAPPTTEPAPEPVEFDLATLPGLVEQIDDLSGVDPLSFAMAFGFPLEIGVPDGSTLYRLDTTVTTRTGDEPSFNDVGIGYSVIAPGGAIPDVDIDLDDNGPGSVQITEVWDPIMSELGYERKNSTTSDPGDPGGPNTVNHVYVPTEAAATDVNGSPAEIGTVFVWGDEDITGASYRSDESTLQGGYVVDLSADVAPDIVPIPLIASLLDVMPVPDGATFTNAALRLNPRSPDSFDADKGLNYVEIALEWDAAADATPDELARFYTDADFDGEVLFPGEESFFAEGTYEVGEVSSYGDTDYRLPVLFLMRYDGVLSLSAASEAGEPAEITYRVTLNPTDTELAPPE